MSVDPYSLIPPLSQLEQNEKNKTKKQKEEQEVKVDINLRIVHRTIILLIQKHYKLPISDLRELLKKRLTIKAEEFLQKHFGAVENYLSSRFPFLFFYDESLKKNVVVLDTKCQGINETSLLTPKETKNVQEEKKKQPKKNKTIIQLLAQEEEIQQENQNLPIGCEFGYMESGFTKEIHVVEFLEAFLFRFKTITLDSLETLLKKKKKNEVILRKIASKHRLFAHFFMKNYRKRFVCKKQNLQLQNRRFRELTKLKSEYEKNQNNNN
ncbi:hypothetical protein M0813_25512 [Anaeramoeba flamelloides]|uniref:CDT1 Geminin-binding domain-containing protein n=1 Tax=Anaeramoeba flamelloides TaxID=1746091 RepID=A0AAV7ZUC2_9EUKA|nr:hypothetical protein M0812_09942 [Anaeramoeba flamelloides]KAJ6238929.1 hypothetical protein M0813_25512 [Anaeramoeba flamelloides]